MKEHRITTGENRYSLERSWPHIVTTQILSPADPALLESVTAAINNSQLIILPTDTVYGAGANAFDEQAIRRLFQAKRRDRDKGIPILLADRIDLDQVARDIPDAAEKLMDRFWPGPLTLILPKRRGLPPSLSRTNFIAVRMPDHHVCRKIIRAAGGALAATSANLSGQEPALTIADALRDLAGTVAVAIDGGPSRGTVASTVVDCSRDMLHILREGPLTLEDLLQGDR